VAKNITNIVFEPGAIILHRDSGPPTKYLLTNIIRLLDIPLGIDQTQVVALKTLSNLIVVLIRTLIARGVLNESFLEDDDLSLNALIETVEAMDGSYSDPNLHDV